MKDTKKSTKKIDTVRVNLKSESNFKFEDILSSSDVDGREYAIKGKDVTLNILENTKAYIIGLVETSRRFNVPPKKNRTKKKIESIGLLVDEGLAYANIFVYDKSKRILMYEVNKNGCYIDHFIEFVYKCCSLKSSEFKEIDIEVEAVLSVDGFNKILNMSVKKSIEFKIARPSEIVSLYNDKHGAVAENVRIAVATHSDRVSAKFEVMMTGQAKHEGKNLAIKPVGVILSQLTQLMVGEHRANLEKLEVVGYEEDSEDNKLSAIDLVSDRYKKYIKLDEPRDNSDLLEGQRKKEIKELYQKCKTDFNAMFKD